MLNEIVSVYYAITSYIHSDVCVILNVAKTTKIECDPTLYRTYDDGVVVAPHEKWRSGHHFHQRNGTQNKSRKKREKKP